MMDIAFRRLRAFSLIVVIALALSLLPGPIRAEDPFDINVLMSLTGSAAFLGHDETAVLRVLEKSVNNNGGIRGRRIHFVILDDQSNPVVSLQLANELIAKNVTIILGPTVTATCSSIVPVLTNGPLNYCFAPGTHPPDGSYTFSSSVSSADFISTNIRYMRLRGWTKIALVVTSDASGQDGERGIDEAVLRPENKGIVTIVDREHFNPTDVSVAAQISRIKASGAQAAIVYTVGTPFGTFLRSAYEGGLEIPLFTTGANYNYTALGTYAPFTPQTLYMALAAYVAPDRLPRGPMRRVVTSYLDSLKADGIRPSQNHIAAWDPAMIVVTALRALGTGATPAQLRGYIANLTNWVGVEGVYDFHKIPQRGVGGDWLFVSHWDPVKQTMTPVSKAGGIP